MVDCNHWRRPCNLNPAAGWRSFLSIEMREEDKEKYQAAPISFTWGGRAFIIISEDGGSYFMGIYLRY